MELAVASEEIGFSCRRKPDMNVIYIDKEEAVTEDHGLEESREGRTGVGKFAVNKNTLNAVLHEGHRPIQKRFAPDTIVMHLQEQGRGVGEETASVDKFSFATTTLVEAALEVREDTIGVKAKEVVY